MEKVFFLNYNKGAAYSHMLSKDLKIMVMSREELFIINRRKHHNV